MNLGIQAERTAKAIERMNTSMEQLATARKITLPPEVRASRDTGIQRLQDLERMADFLDALLATEIKAVTTEEKIEIEKVEPVIAEKEISDGGQAQDIHASRPKAQTKQEPAAALAKDKRK